MNSVVSMTELVLCLAEIADLVNPLLSDHHKRVAGIAYNLCSELGLPPIEQADVTFAGMLHDVGAISIDERLDALRFDFEEGYGHSEKGWALLSTYKPFAGIASIVRFHHTPWDYGRCSGKDCGSIPLGSHILNLADRIAVSVKPGMGILEQAVEVRRKVSGARGKTFLPELVDVFLEISEKEYFWLDIESASLEGILKAEPFRRGYTLGDEDLLELVKLFGRIIDFRSRFTATHSSGVAAVAEVLAKNAGFGKEECSMMGAAGYIHDLGKLAVPAEILEKPSGLTKQEYSLIKTHSYFTDRVLRGVKGFETIREWGALHHERLDGKGYPFHLEAEQLSTGSRIMAVADVFVALTENRPYRRGLSPERTLKVIREMVRSGALDSEIVSMLDDLYHDINDIRVHAQYAAEREYRDFACLFG